MDEIFGVVFDYSVLLDNVGVADITTCHQHFLFGQHQPCEFGIESDVVLPHPSQSVPLVNSPVQSARVETTTQIINFTCRFWKISVETPS